MSSHWMAVLALCLLPACGPEASPPKPTAAMALPPDYDSPNLLPYGGPPGT